MRPAATIPSLPVRAEIADGRVVMAVGDDDAALRVRGRDHTPLGEGEPIATLAVTADGYNATVKLTGDAVDELADALDDVREGGAGDD